MNGYGLADHAPERWMTPDNSFVLPLQTRPQDAELGRVWMRDTYVNYFEVNGVGTYYCTGTTRAAGMEKAYAWNDGIYLWSAPDLQGPWRLVDTSALHPGRPLGQVWAQDMHDLNRPGRVVVAPYQRHAEADNAWGRRGEVWAPELHLIRGKWYLVACMGDAAILPGSFILVSEGGPEGPYRNIAGNVDKPLGDMLPRKPGCYPIDGSLFDDGDRGVHLVLHNFLHARMTADMEDIEPRTALPVFQEALYASEPYLEGAYVFKHEGRYHLMHAAWAYEAADASMGYMPGPRDRKLHYDTIVAVADRFEGPYSPRRTMGVGIGHNNAFRDARGQLWATFFRNPAHGHWAQPQHKPEAAVAGVVRLHLTDGDLLAIRP